MLYIHCNPKKVLQLDHQIPQIHASFMLIGLQVKLTSTNNCRFLKVNIFFLIITRQSIQCPCLHHRGGV